MPHRPFHRQCASTRSAGGLSQGSDALRDLLPLRPGPRRQGGVIALKAALRRPGLVTHLILSVTSGGLDLASLGAQDWRPAFNQANPSLPGWFSGQRENLTARLPGIQVPALLWGNADPISPVRVGQCLASLLPRAELHVFPDGDHGRASSFAHAVAPLIDRQLLTRA